MRRASKAGPSGHFFDVRRAVGMLWSTRRTSKTCPCGHGLDVREIGRWWTPTEHRKHAHLGMLSIFSE